MDNELMHLLIAYLAGAKTLADVRHGVTLNIWDAPDDRESIVDHVAIELSHLDLGDSDEAYFRSQVEDILGMISFVYNESELDFVHPESTVAASMNESYTDPVILPVHVFA